MEAMASGLPIVAARCGGYLEMIEENKTGLLFSPNDIQDLSLAIKALLKDPGKAEQFGQAGREKVIREFSMETISEVAEAFYMKALNG